MRQQTLKRQSQGDTLVLCNRGTLPSCFSKEVKVLGVWCLHGLTWVVGCGRTTLSVWEFLQVPLSASLHKQPWHCTGWVLAVPAFILDRGV